MPTCFNTLKDYSNRFNWYPLKFSKNWFSLERFRQTGSQKGYHLIWKPSVLILRTGLKTLKVLTPEVRIVAWHWFKLNFMLVKAWTLSKLLLLQIWLPILLGMDATFYTCLCFYPFNEAKKRNQGSDKVHPSMGCKREATGVFFWGCFFNEAEQQSQQTRCCCWDLPKVKLSGRGPTAGLSHLHTSEFEPRTFFSGPEVPHTGYTTEPSPLICYKSFWLVTSSAV